MVPIISLSLSLCPYNTPSRTPPSRFSRSESSYTTTGPALPSQTSTVWRGPRPAPSPPPPTASTPSTPPWEPSPPMAPFPTPTPPTSPSSPPPPTLKG